MATPDAHADPLRDPASGLQHALALSPRQPDRRHPGNPRDAGARGADASSRRSRPVPAERPALRRDVRGSVRPVQLHLDAGPLRVEGLRGGQSGHDVDSINIAIMKYPQKENQNKLKIDILLNKFEFISITLNHFFIVI